MSASSKTRSRLLVTASVLCAAILVILPSVFNFISGAEQPTVPSGTIIADEASRDVASSRRTFPETKPQPLARDPRGHYPSLGVLESGLDQMRDEQIADAILREVHEQELAAADLVAYLLNDSYYGDFIGIGVRGLTRTSAGGGGITASGSAFRGGGMGGGGGFAGAPSQGGTGAPVNGNPGLSAFKGLGQPPSGQGVVLTPKVGGGDLVVSPEIELILTDTPVSFGPQTSQFDQAPVPKSPTSVPEPATLALTGLGLCGVIATARAGRRRSQ